MKAVRWEEIPDEDVRPGVRRRAIGTSDVLLVMNECRPGMDVRPHSHDFDQLALPAADNARRADGAPAGRRCALEHLAVPLR